MNNEMNILRHQNESLIEPSKIKMLLIQNISIFKIKLI